MNVTSGNASVAKANPISEAQRAAVVSTSKHNLGLVIDGLKSVDDGSLAKSIEALEWVDVNLGIR